MANPDYRTYFGFLAAAANESTISGRAAVNTRPAFRTSLIAPKAATDAFATGKTEQAVDIYDAFRPSTFKTVTQVDAV